MKHPLICIFLGTCAFAGGVFGTMLLQHSPVISAENGKAPPPPPAFDSFLERAYLHE